MYQSGSDNLNSTKQVPNTFPYGRYLGGAVSGSHKNYNYADTPAARTIAERPDYVIINPNTAAATYTFLYASTASIGGTDFMAFDTAPALTGSISSADQHESIRLDISPIAWDYGHVNTAGVTGEVTFVYSKQDK